MTATRNLQELLDLARRQQVFLEMLARSWVGDYGSGGGSIFCGKGCRNCCSLAVHTGFAEALAVARGLDDGQALAVEAYATKLRRLVDGVSELPQYLRLHRREMGFCPLLNDAGECSVYSARPLTCRSLISTKESSWCGIDFAGVAQADRQAFLSSLDKKVVAYPSHYVAVLQESGKELEEAGAKSMRNMLGFALYGNLGVLVHLIRNHALDQASLVGRAKAVEVIASAGFAHPLLLIFS